MSRTVLVLRPQPGADRTARRARALGLEPVVAPLFEIVPLDWRAPDPAAYDAVLLTSANAARLAGEHFTSLPVYAVGEATAEAARRMGYPAVRVGPADGAAAAAMMAADGIARAIHLCGRDHVAVSAAGVSIDRIPVYAAEQVPALPEPARVALSEGALVLLHSARAAARLASLVADRKGIRLAAISAAVAAAAGEGWAGKTAAAAPRDEALLELAAQLCHNAGKQGYRVGKHGI